jgi:Ca2+-binding RTX toxin-like protein
MKKRARNEITITGTTGDDLLFGTPDPDTIDAGNGNDTLIGEGGADTLIGGAGNDAYRVEEMGDVVVEAAGGGFDAVYAVGSYTLGAGSEVELLSAIDPASTVGMTLIGNEFANLIYGNAGVNTLIGEGGNDTLIGGAGNDFYRVETAGDTVIENAGGGFDSVYAVGSYTLAAGSEVELLSAIDPASTAGMTLIGNEFANLIYGNAGINTLIGEGGNDTLIGGGGNDFYRVETAGDTVVEGAGGGFDSVYAVGSYTLAAGSEVELLSAIDPASSAGMTLIGNEFANQIYGNAGVNTLIGEGGNDTLIGGGGNDFYRVETAGDTVIEGAGGGFDSVYAVGSYTLAAGSEVELLSAIDPASTAGMTLIGNNFANQIYGNAGVNTLIGEGGNDTLAGGAGDDFYRVETAGDSVVEGAGGGFDSIYAVTSYTLAAGSEVELLSAIDPGAANAMDLTGNEFANRLYGNAGVNILDGKGGADLLTGSAGADIFAFTTTLGAGNVDTVADFVSGTDKIQLSGASGQPFAALATGTLHSGAFRIGAAALDADDYLIYNSGTGALLYDADGNGAGAAVQFATLSTGLELNYGDFVIAGPANNTPVISSAATANVAENSAASTIVYQTVATDADGDAIVYSLGGVDASLLTIDASGAVRLITPANFEAKASYSFTVMVSDSGSATVKAVTLTITDVAESATPIINETAAPNDSTGTAQAIDRGTFVVATNPNLPNDDLASATIVGNLSSNSDKDFFSITLQAGEQLILDIDGTTNSLDSFLTLYGSNGALIGDNDDLISADPGSNPPFGHNTDSQIIFRAATSGTYYFSVGSFENMSNGNYQLHVSIGPQATAAQLIDEDIDALISGAEWNHTNLTFGFPTLASQYPSDFEEVSPPTKFQAFNPAQQAATIQLLQLISNVSTLTFTQNTVNPGQADLRFAESSEAEVAYAYYPNNQGPGDQGGSAWFNHTNFNAPGRGNYAWMGILHETGHALGLKHGHEFPLAISADRDSVEYTVMTYRSYPGDSVEGGYTNETYGYPQTLMMYDIAALQEMYNGANYAFNSGNSVYTWDITTGEMAINGVGQGEVGNGDGTVSASENRILMTIWDGGGTDTYDLSSYAVGSTIDLRPGEWTTASTLQLANLGGTTNPVYARGNIANALMYQGNTASLIENAKTGSGADTLIANQVANQLTGGGGADTFKWMASGDAGTGALADTLLDFLSGSDKIDLSAIDANPATGGNDAFTFLGTGAFSNVAGQVRYQVTGGHAHVFADLDGNGIADMEIIVNNNTILAAPDFTF